MWRIIKILYVIWKLALRVYKIFKWIWDRLRR